MSKKLTTSVAKRKVKKCLENEDYEIDLTGYTEMEDGAAEIIASCDLPIDLRDLNVLSEQSAQHLSKHEKSLDLAKVFKLEIGAARHLARKKSFIHFEMTEIPESIAAVFAAGEAMLQMTGLKKLNGSNEHLEFARFLRNTQQLGRLHNLTEIDPKIISEIPELKK